MSPAIEEADRCNLHGREFNTGNENYMLPSDKPEYERLKLQHASQTLTLGGLYPGRDAVHKVLAPEDGIIRSAIDIGSGSGIWTIEFAKEFPHVQVIGLDLAPNPAIDVPPNCSFVVGDARNGFPQYEGKFDLVHNRSMGVGLEPGGYPEYLENTVSKILRPGGLIMMGEGDLQILDKNKNPYPSGLKPGDAGYSPTYHVFEVLLSIIKLPAGVLSKGVAAWLRDILSENQNFENVEGLTIYIPLIKDNTNSLAGEYMKRNTQIMLHSFKPLLLTRGYTEETIDNWIADIDAEIKENKTELLSAWHFAWATRK